MAAFRATSRLGPCLAAAGILLAILTACGGGPTLTGADLGKQPAPDFTLTDQRGQTVRLSQFRGQAVVLTFIYTHCPDVCPATAKKLRTVDELLPPTAREHVALLAVTIDPARDTTAALQDFSRQHGLNDNPHWFALRGDGATLASVWHTYGIYPGRMAVPASPAAAGTYELGHTDAVYVIDPQGRERVLVHSDLDPQTLASDLAGLVG